MKPNVLRDFFKLELETLQAKTGMRQLELIMAKDTWEQDLSQLLDILVAECNRPPFDIVGVDQKMKAIQDAIVSDKDFIGLNAKFVYRALATWWQFNGGRYLEKHMQSLPKEVQPEPAPPEVREKYLKEWEDSLKAASNNFGGVPRLSAEEIKREGQETENVLSEQLNQLSKKKGGHATPEERFFMKQRIREVCARVYSHLDPNRLPAFRNFKVEGYEIFCESLEKAQEIYMEAIATERKCHAREK